MGDVRAEADNDLEAPLVATGGPVRVKQDTATDYDKLRDGPLRYLGYANEVGEAFLAWVAPVWYYITYVVAVAYVFWDTSDKWWATFKLARCSPPGWELEAVGVGAVGLSHMLAFFRGLDTLLWQLLASVVVPGYVIHVIVALTAGALELLETRRAAMGLLLRAADMMGVSTETFVSTFNRSVPTFVGLIMIPRIVEPIDKGMDALLSATLRPVLRWLVCKKVGDTDLGLAICKDCKL